MDSMSVTLIMVEKFMQRFLKEHLGCFKKGADGKSSSKNYQSF